MKRSLQGKFRIVRVLPQEHRITDYSCLLSQELEQLSTPTSCCNSTGKGQRWRG